MSLQVSLPQFLSRPIGGQTRGILANSPVVVLAVGAGLLLVWLPLGEAAVLTALAALGIATLVEPLAGLVGGLFLGLLRAYLQAEVPQVPAQIGHLFVALAVASWLARGLMKRNVSLLLQGREAALPLLVALLSFVGAGWISLWNGAYLANYGLPELAKWLEMVLVFVVVVERARPRHLPGLLAGVLLVGVFQASVGLYQFGLRGEGPEHFRIPGTDFYRAYGTFEQPNPYAGYLAMSLSLVVGLLGSALSDWWHARGSPGRTQAPKGVPAPGFGPLAPRYVASLCVAGGILAAALGASWSRGAWIGFAAALAAMALALPRHATRGVLLLGLLAALGVILYLAGLLPPSVVARLTDFAAEVRLQDVRGMAISPANYAVLERLAHWQAAIEMWRSAVWTGVGLGCYEAAYPHFALINWPIALGHAHNIYLNLLAETGLAGLAAYLALWGGAFRLVWIARQRTSGLARGVAVGLLGAWTQLTVHHLFDNLYVNNAHLLVGLLMGLGVLILPSS